MEQKDKELLLKDLNSRVYYGVKCKSQCFKSRSLLWIEDSRCVFKFQGEDGEDEYGELDIDEWNVRPYLRPMSSMTEEEIKDLQQINSQFCFCRSDSYAYVGAADDGFCSVSDMEQILSYLYAHHFDFRGLIPLCLALEAPKGMY